MTFLSGGADKTVRLYDASNGGELRQFAGAEGSVYSVAFHPQGQLIAGCGIDKKVRLWNVISGQPANTLAGHTDDVYRVQFNPAGTRLLSIGYAGSLRIWDVSTGKSVYTTKLPVALYSGCYSTDGKKVALTANDAKTYIVDLPQQAH